MKKLLIGIRWFGNILRSLAYDLRYAMTDGFRIRAGAGSYSSYRAVKLYPDYLKLGAALTAVKPLALKFCRGNGLDVGAGRWPLPGARPIEDGEVENAYALNVADGSQDFLFSSHTLEHLDRPWDALAEWSRALKQDGILFLYLPHPACEMWAPANLRFHKWSPDPVVLEERLAKEFGYEILYVTYLPDAFFSFVIIAQKRSIK